LEKNKTKTNVISTYSIKQSQNATVWFCGNWKNILRLF